MVSTRSANVDPAGTDFLANRRAMQAALAELDELHGGLLDAGGQRYVDRHHERGRLLARERLELLVDRGSPLLELSALAGWGTDDPLGGGVVTAIGRVNGHLCVLVANEPTVRGGSMGPTTVKKILRAYEIAHSNELPLVNLVESAGADLPKQAETFVPGGATFRQISRLSKRGIPTIAIVFGPSTAGGAYVPGMSDYIILVEGQAKMFLGGPPLVKMATDEDADEETLGGAEMHARVSGVADYLARDEPDAIAIAREILGHYSRDGQPRLRGEEPTLDSEELLGIPSADPRVPYDMREIILRVLDASRLEEFKPLYGPNLVCGWGLLHGQRIGVLANNGILFPAEAQKGAQFVQLANQAQTPLLFMHNITGFMVGTRYERDGIIKDGAKLINAVSNSSVPHLVLMVGSSYGAGNYAMSGRAFEPRFVFSWPSHRVAVMGGKQLAGVMSIIRRASAERSGRSFDEDKDLAERGAIEAQIDGESTALYSTGHLWDDGLIDPRDTRVVLGIALSAISKRPVSQDRGYAVFRM